MKKLVVVFDVPNDEAAAQLQFWIEQNLRPGRMTLIDDPESLLEDMTEAADTMAALMQGGD